MIRITDQYFWNVVFSLFFGLLVVMGAIILQGEARIAWGNLTLTDYVLVTLASWRVVRLFVYDAVTKWFREQFYDVKKVRRGYSLEKPKAGPRRTLCDLLSCPWCFGVWASATVLFFYLLTEWAVFPVIILAVSAVATFLQILTNYLGHSAEIAKKRSELL